MEIIVVFEIRKATLKWPCLLLLLLLHQLSSWEEQDDDDNDDAAAAAGYDDDHDDDNDGQTQKENLGFIRNCLTAKVSHWKLFGQVR